MGYLHVEVTSAWNAKKPAGVCGDAFLSFRTPEATVVILADGIGSGVKANIYANMTISRLETLLSEGFSLRRAFSSLVNTMHESRGTDMPYAVFTVARILNNGETTVLAYEMPESIFVGRHSASVLKRRNFPLGNDVISETNLFLEPDEGLLLYSDGITLAGIGGSTRNGWSSDEVCRFVNDQLVSGEFKSQLAQRVHKHARKLWGKKCGDDCTVVGALCRLGKVATVFTGPPADKTRDNKVVEEFLNMPGLKIVCGATTAQVVARQLKRQLQINKADASLIAPPGYSIEGVDLVTEGAVTLNQLFNIFDADPVYFEHYSSVTRLYDALIDADRINFMVGGSENIGHADIAFRQQGIMSRHKVIELLAQKLRADGRLVDIRQV
ncbi:MAG: serine/threonine-protein phosphatase [Candidatus Riflebacteria bacterium]|nr:serine/threonine-protein phosphatase [Candidatus Riflebacteria bacterium]